MLGVTVCFLILSIVAASTVDDGILKACYTSMHILANTSLRASTIGTVISGILLSVLTNWGLFTYWWIVIKELLTVLSIGIGMVGIYFWTLKAVTISTNLGLHSFQQTDFIINNYQLWVGISLQLLSLLAMVAISVFKPWGKIKSKKVI